MPASDSRLRTMLGAARAVVTVMALAMAAVSAAPAGRQRATYAIVRLLDDESATGFDEREVVKGRVILTLALDARERETRSIDAGFGAN